MYMYVIDNKLYNKLYYGFGVKVSDNIRKI